MHVLHLNNLNVCTRILYIYSICKQIEIYSICKQIEIFVHVDKDIVYNYYMLIRIIQIE